MLLLLNTHIEINMTLTNSFHSVNRRLLDVLLELNESQPPKFETNTSDRFASDIDSKEKFLDLSLWNNEVNHLASLYDEAFEFSEDESAAPASRNPMSLLEWLRRNQPNVFSSENTDTPTGEANHTAPGNSNGVFSNSMHTGNGNLSNNAGSGDIQNMAQTKGKKKRKAGNTESASFDSELNSQPRKSKKAKKEIKTDLEKHVQSD